MHYLEKINSFKKKRTYFKKYYHNAYEWCNIILTLAVWAALLSELFSWWADIADGTGDAIGVLLATVNSDSWVYWFEVDKGSLTEEDNWAPDEVCLERAINIYEWN